EPGEGKLCILPARLQAADSVAPPRKRRNRNDGGARRRRRLRFRATGLPAEAGATHHAFLVAAESAAEGHAGAVADDPLVADGQGPFPTLRSHADAHAVPA